MNIPIEEVEAKLLEAKIEPSKVTTIVKDLVAVAEELKEERKANADPKQKWEFIIAVNDPEGKIGDEFTGWVVQQQEGQDAGLIMSKMRDAASVQNENTKRKKQRLACLADIFENIKSKFLKEKGIRVKTKIPVRVLSVNGKSL